MNDLQDLSTQILAAEPFGYRRLVAVAGPPASGKSTLAADIVGHLQKNGEAAQLVPMDGFHLDDSLLTARGLLDRKGAPQTFDVHGFAAMVGRLKTDTPVVYPIFDRTREIAIAGVGYVGPECRTVVVEGNYLLLDAPIWRDLQDVWDISIFLRVDEGTLEQRLSARWETHGYTPEDALQKIAGNDIPNARLVLTQSLPATITV